MARPEPNRVPPPRDRPLGRMIRLVRDQRADRQDAIEEMGEVCLVRLEILADQLEQVFADVPTDDARFDFAISSGLHPRLWIDQVAHVAMARDCRTYRFLLDRRDGRVVLAESDRPGPVAEAVTRYIAERLVERRTMLEGRKEPAMPGWARPFAPVAEPSASSWKEYLSGALLVLLGMIAGAGILVALLSDIWPELF